MPGDEVQVSARISFAQRDAIRAHGGLVHLIRKFLADNSAESSVLERTGPNQGSLLRLANEVA
jgi:hypothetical protein